jgi:photosystem II stability/assembly factor-like uncharacterized protein
MNFFFFSSIIIGLSAQIIMRAPVDIHGFDFVSPDEGFFVGKEGRIFHTWDGGETFAEQESGVEFLLTAVDFADPVNGWAVGELGTILHTRDGGESWEKQPSPVRYHLLDILAISAEEAWAVGDWGAVLRTSDGGKTWNDLSLTVIAGEEPIPEPVAFEDAIDPEKGELLVSRGETLSPQIMNLLKEKRIRVRIRNDIILNNIFFLDKNTGWVAGEAGTLFFTEDGGRSFARRNIGEIEDPFGPPPLSLYAVTFLSPSQGIAAGLLGSIHLTDDGGRLWKNIDTGIKSDLYSVSSSGDVVCACGAKGAILVSTDGGKSFTPVSKPDLFRHWLRRAKAFPDRCDFVGMDGLLVRVKLR